VDYLLLLLLLNLIGLILGRRDVLQEIVNMQNYEGMFLPVALRFVYMHVIIIIVARFLYT